MFVLAERERPDRGGVQPFQEPVRAADYRGLWQIPHHWHDSQVSDLWRLRGICHMHFEVSRPHPAESVREVEESSVADDPVCEVPSVEVCPDPSVGEVFSVCDFQDGSLFGLQCDCEPAGLFITEVYDQIPSVGGEPWSWPGEGEAHCVFRGEHEWDWLSPKVVLEFLRARRAE